MTKRSKQAHMLPAAALLLAMILLLAACGGNGGNEGGDAAPTSQATDTPTATVEPAGSQENTGGEEEGQQENGGGAISGKDKDLFLQIAQDTAELSSYKVTMNTDQQMEINGETMNSSTQMEMTAVMKPKLALHQMTSVNAGEIRQTIESYLLEDGFYMKDPASGAWMKYPAEMSEQLTQAADSSLSDTLDSLMSFADDLVIEEEGSNYVVTLTATDGDFGKLLGEMGDMGGATEIHSMEYRMVVEKKTHYPLSLDMTMDMSVGEGEYRTRIVSETSSTYSEHNGIAEIKVTAEVLEAKSLLDPTAE